MGSIGVKGDKFQLTVCLGNYDDYEEARKDLETIQNVFGRKVISTGIKSGSGY